MLNKLQQLTILILCLLTLGCTTTPAEKPLDLKSSAENLVAKDPTSTTFNAFLSEHGYEQANLPLTHWDIDSLTLCALYYHTKLDLAKQQLALARLSLQTAAIRQLPTLNADLARSNQANGDIRPWSYGLSIDIPIETYNKRGLKIEKAEKNVAIAEVDLAELAWQLRSQIAADLITYHQTQAEINLLEEELATQNNIVEMLEKRFNAGMASNTELTTARLLALKVQHQLKNKLAGLQKIDALLAADVGLTSEKFSKIKIKPLSITETLSRQQAVLEERLTTETLREEALLNRIDLRRRILQYASAETEIKLQAAKQMPDITISPGILYEFGDRIWSLGFSRLLNMLQKNTALIEEAKQLRAVQGAAVENLQADIIASVTNTKIRYASAKHTTEQAAQALDVQSTIADKMQKQFDAGLIGKLDLTRYKLNTIIAKQQLATSQFSQLIAADQIENLMQKPLYNNFTMPSLTTSELE
jgi:outer membrane protein, heavy metal efflux system